VDGEVKSSAWLRITGTFWDDPALAGDPHSIDLHYTNRDSTGPGDIPNTFAPAAGRLRLQGSGRWVRHSWTIEDAGFRDFMQGTSDFRFACSGRVCVDRVEVARLSGPEDLDEVLVGAHYYPWYDVGRWNYSECNGGALRLELVPAQPPALGRYDSSSATVVDRHLRWSAEHGVNVWILEFIRPDSREDRNCRQVIFPNRRSGDVRYTVLYDVAIRFGGDLQLTPERINTVRGDVSHLARFYFNQPTYWKISGRPVVLIYVTRALQGDIDAFEDAMREGAADLGFDVYLVGDEFFFPSGPNSNRIARWDAIFGYDCYASHGGYWGENGNLELFSDRTAQYAAAAGNSGVVFFPSCAPGFNDRAIRRTCADHPAMSRRLSPSSPEGSLFRELFGNLAMKHLDSEIPFISITSFNEWHEDTQIEPTGGAGGSTTEDTSPSGDAYTQGIGHGDYGLEYLEIIRDATLAITGRVLAEGKGVAGVEIEVLLGDQVVVARTSFSTGAYTIPWRRLSSGRSYRLRVRAEGYPELVSNSVRVRSGQTVTDFDLVLDLEPVFRRADADRSGAIDLSDVITILGVLFLGEGSFGCADAADANDDGLINIADAIATLGWLFLGGVDIPPPGPDSCGPDPTSGDPHDCGSYPPCSG